MFDLIAQAAPTGEELEWVNVIVGISAKLGIPGGVGGALYFAYRIGKWLQPWVEKLFTAHLELVDSLKDSLKTITAMQATIAAKTEATHEAIDAAARLAERVGRTTTHAEAFTEHCRQIREAIE